MIPPVDDKPLFKKEVVYFHFAQPLEKLSPFQSLIQYVQKSMGWSKFGTTHVFVSLNDKIIDRTGVHTITSEVDIVKYLAKNYRGFLIESYGLKEQKVTSNFFGLHKFINVREPYFFEDENGEVFGSTMIYPNNSIYGIGKATPVTLKEIATSMILGTPISEATAIGKANSVFNFESVEKLKNPTYCSLIVSALIPELNDFQLTRYPALTHSLFEKYYRANGIEKSVSVIEKE